MADNSTGSENGKIGAILEKLANHPTRGEKTVLYNSLVAAVNDAASVMVGR